MGIRIETNKNLTLLYSLLNRFNQAGGEVNTHPLREKVKKHFKDYSGREPNVDEYIHEHKVVIWALTVGNPPKFKPKNIEISSELQWHVDKGEIIKPYLVEFYNNTDFEIYYKEIEEKLEVMKGEMEKIIAKTSIESLLGDVWGIKAEQNMVLIPNPFTWGSFGPQIGDVNYQVIGVMGEVNKRALLHTIAHEGSHPLAKQILKPYRKDIDKKEKLLKIAQKHPKYPNSYNVWRTCFEEHLIRAVQIGLINPLIADDYDYDIPTALKWEKNNKGMVFIDTFYENLQKGDISGSIPKILEALK